MVNSLSAKQNYNDYLNLGKRIAMARQSLGKSQKEVSMQLSIPQSTYAGYETGARKIPIPVLKKLAEIYCVSLDVLLDTNELDKELIMLERKYSVLDKKGKQTVKVVLNNEFIRCQYEKKYSAIDFSAPIAAHSNSNTDLELLRQDIEDLLDT